jgi:hypothetical protein
LQKIVFRHAKRLAEADGYRLKVIGHTQNTPIQEATASEVRQSTDSGGVHRIPHLRFEDQKLASFSGFVVFQAPLERLLLKGGASAALFFSSGDLSDLWPLWGRTASDHASSLGFSASSEVRNDGLRLAPIMHENWFKKGRAKETPGLISIDTFRSRVA